ncbi:MAG: SDR family NAD(P)-dependent oxidoreductase [Planctomycetota bacterium]|nr:MAG: SDR family NAD(P)-dependent oxidoreductase [Planctomycetota bacterium]
MGRESKSAYDASMVAFAQQYGPWALISGASSGIGASFAENLARRGLSLALVARRKSRLQALAQRLQAEHGAECLVLPEDLLNPVAPQRLQEAMAGREIGLLVNNAGYGGLGAFEQQDFATLRNMVRLNCEAVLALAHHFVPPMVERGRGGMVMVASVAGMLPCPWMSVYGATKAFDLQLGEALHVELKPKGVDVVTVCPGHTASEFHQIAGVHGPVPGREAQPEEVVALALSKLGKGNSTVEGLQNKILANAPRFFPRSWTAAVSGKVLAKRLEHLPDSKA